MRDIEFIKISKAFLDDLYKIALILFPMEATAIIIGGIENKVFKSEKIILPPDLAFFDMVDDIKFFRKSKTLKEIKNRLNKLYEGQNYQEYISVKINILMEKKSKSIKIFQEYKDYFLMNYKNSIKDKNNNNNKYQDIFISPYHDGYDWVSEKQPFLCWHSHPLPNYYNLKKYSIPSHGDTIQILKLLQREQKVVGEIITTIFERGKIIHKGFRVPEFVYWKSYIFKFRKNRKMKIRGKIPIII